MLNSPKELVAEVFRLREKIRKFVLLMEQAENMIGVAEPSDEDIDKYNRLKKELNL